MTDQMPDDFISIGKTVLGIISETVCSLSEYQHCVADIRSAYVSSNLTLILEGVQNTTYKVIVEGPQDNDNYPKRCLRA